MRVISIVGQKGGIAKTSSCLHVARVLAGSGLKTLVIDCDYHQANLTYNLVGPIWEKGNQIGICNRIVTGEDLRDAIVPTPYDNLHIVPGEKKNSRGAPYDIAASLGSLANSEGQDAAINVLREMIDESGISQDYDFALIDNQPGLGIEVGNSVVASDFVLQPVILEDFSVDSLTDTIKMCEGIRVKNPYIENLGIFVSKYFKNRKASEENFERTKNICKENNVYLFKTRIPHYTGFTSLASKGLTVFDLPKSKQKGAKEYVNLIGEIMDRIEYIESKDNTTQNQPELR